MPIVLIADLLRRGGSLLKRWWPYLAVMVVLVTAGVMVHRAGERAAEREAQLQRAQDEADRQKALAAAEKLRQDVQRQIAEATAQARQNAARLAQETAAREQADQVRHDRDVAAIASARTDSMVEADGPLDRLFPGDAK